MRKDKTDGRKMDRERDSDRVTDRHPSAINRKSKKTVLFVRRILS